MLLIDDVVGVQYYRTPRAKVVEPSQQESWYCTPMQTLPLGSDQDQNVNLDLNPLVIANLALPLLCSFQQCIMWCRDKSKKMFCQKEETIVVRNIMDLRYMTHMTTNFNLATVLLPSISGLMWYYELGKKPASTKCIIIRYGQLIDYPFHEECLFMQ